jgi:hypothetical protein
MGYVEARYVIFYVFFMLTTLYIASIADISGFVEQTTHEKSVLAEWLKPIEFRLDMSNLLFSFPQQLLALPEQLGQKFYALTTLSFANTELMLVNLFIITLTIGFIFMIVVMIR